MRIVDLHNFRGAYLYCGRALPYHRTFGPLKESPLGNPFKPKEHGANCLKLYREWIR